MAIKIVSDPTTLNDLSAYQRAYDNIMVKRKKVTKQTEEMICKG